MAAVAGGCTLEAVAAVVGSRTDDDAEPDVLEVLARLVDHSLLRDIAGPDGESILPGTAFQRRINASLGNRTGKIRS